MVVLIRNRENQLFRLNLAEYFLIEENGSFKKITPRPKILFDNSALVIVSKLDRKIYDFTGNKASEKKKTAAAELAENLGKKFQYEVEQIVIPSDEISPEHLQFIEYFIDDYYFPKTQIDITKYLICYFCEKPLDRKSDICPNCGKDVIYCFVCNLPILKGDKIGKCCKCEAVAHLIHFKEWIKALGMCPKCSEKIPIDCIIPISEENKKKFFKK